MNSETLQDLSILITKPITTAKKLELALQNLGAFTSTLPCVEILPPHHSKPLKEALQNLTQFDIAIFVSAHAVPAIAPRWHADAIATVFAIGPGTQAALAKHNIKAQIPAKYNSEGLLAHPLLQQIAQKNIALFCGEDPRPLLADELSKRDALVHKINCYRRQIPHTDPVAALYVLNKANINVIISTSTESLQSLYTMLGEKGREWLLNQSLLVISPTMAELATTLGFKRDIILAENATDEAVIAALLTWQQHH